MMNSKKALIKAATLIGASTAGTVHILHFYYNVLPAERIAKKMENVKNEILEVLETINDDWILNQIYRFIVNMRG